MALGDDALAAGMDIVEPEADRREGANEITKTRDYIAAFHETAMDAVATRLPSSDVYDGTGSVANKVPRYDGSGRLIAATPTAPNHAAAKAYVDAAVAGIDLSSRVAKSGDTMTGHLYLPNSTAATSSYTVAYINGDGRVSRGASSERYKHDIDRSPDVPDVFAVPIASYIMNGDPDETPRYGPIAEDLAANPVTAPFVVYDTEGRPDSLDVISYLMAALAQLHARVQELEAKQT